jgi:hypothetical protein
VIRVEGRELSGREAALAGGELAIALALDAIEMARRACLLGDEREAAARLAAAHDQVRAAHRLAGKAMEQAGRAADLAAGVSHEAPF